MAFTRPTLAELVTRVRSDLRGRLEINGALLRRAMADVIGAVWAGAVHLLHGYIEWAVRQIFATTADREQLLEKAAAYGMSPTPAAFATGDVAATGVNGTDIPAGTIISLDEATKYFVVTGQTIAGGVAALPVKALLAGEAANIPDGTALTIDTIPGVDSACEADGDIDGGVDEESTEEFRARFLLHLREPPQGGADQDYEAWALAVAAPGTTRAWVFEHELGLGTVVVRFVLVDLETGAITFPDAGQVATVQAALEAQRPITVSDVEAMAPDELAVDFTIELDPDNADTRAAVEAELRDLFSREGRPGDPGDPDDGTIPLSKIRTAIGVAEGVEDYTLTVPAADVVPALGKLPTVGVITWV